MSSQPAILQVWGRLLADGPMTVDELSGRLPIERKTVTVGISQLAALGKVRVVEPRYGRNNPTYEAFA